MKNKIAKALAEWRMGENADQQDIEMYEDAADAVLAVMSDEIERAKNTAEIEVLRAVAKSLDGAEPSYFGDLTANLDPHDFGTGAEYGIEVARVYVENVATRLDTKAR